MSRRREINLPVMFLIIETTQSCKMTLALQNLASKWPKTMNFGLFLLLFCPKCPIFSQVWYINLTFSIIRPDIYIWIVVFINIYVETLYFDTYSMPVSVKCNKIWHKIQKNNKNVQNHFVFTENSYKFKFCNKSIFPWCEIIKWKL